LLKDHDHKKRIGDGTRTDNTHVEKFLKTFLNFINLGKGMTIRVNIRRKTSQDKRNGMIMNTTEGEKSLGSEKNNLVF
jgi:hypothetical protein